MYIKERSQLVLKELREYISLIYLTIRNLSCFISQSIIFQLFTFDLFPSHTKFAKFMPNRMKENIMHPFIYFTGTKLIQNTFIILFTFRSYKQGSTFFTGK